MSRKKVILSEPNQASETTLRDFTNNARPRREARERLKTSVLEELWAIWRADPRVPSVKSRRSWAISRNANPRLVDNWFLRRRTCAKKAGQPIQDGSYELSLDPLIIPKREPSATPAETELEAIPDLPGSDDTLVYPPYGEYFNDVEASSDTVFDEDTPTDSKRIESPAYKEARQQSYPEQQQQPSSDEDTSESLLENPSFPVCNRGRGKQPDFTCVPRSTKSAQDEIPSDSGAMSDSRGSLFLPCPRLDFLPDTLSGLSAIPFLFRTPPTISPDNTDDYQRVGDWTVVEDELARLVNDGKLDFSFLDVPHLACMELLD